ncbi:trypsin inhibitor ClTI-1-like [Hypanus sabinus]|uniref:trypsin inhibitor ClTI-1-like n=1 Tax=Hypanus sabinus TaxID=79690 RepID=UPI0028C43EEB|nr:trypsin inhibitor ClTI-1-like [Hypanus sabinus]XP_059813714.1 trypsin inhibitor ClTI-1-like [Hypanus sabinus]
MEFNTDKYPVAARFYTPGSSEEEPDCEDFPDLPICPMFSKKICGTDGVTYINRCNLCLYNWLNDVRVKIKHNGLCVKPERAEEGGRASGGNRESWFE